MGSEMCIRDRSMGMMMLPPTTISAPFKILLFVMADGWNLIIGNLITTFK